MQLVQVQPAPWQSTTGISLASSAPPHVATQSSTPQSTVAVVHTLVPSMHCIAHEPASLHTTSLLEQALLPEHVITQPNSSGHVNVALLHESAP